MFKKGDQVSVYEIKKVISEDETHLCCLTEDPFFHCPVLLKIYPLADLPEDRSYKDLEKHLEGLFLLEHPSIAPVLDSGFEEDYFYYTTDYHDQQYLVERTVAGISAEAVLAVVRDLARALSYAASRDVYHGTLSTAKIHYGDKGQLVIADFGVELYLSAFKSGETVGWTEEQALEDLGQLQLQLLRPSNMDHSGREAEIIAGIENEELKSLTQRFFSSGSDRYLSFSELLEALAPLLDTPPVETRPTCQNRALENCDENGISLQQRELVLPHVRKLVSEKNSYKAQLEEALLQQHEIAEELQRTREGLEQATRQQIEAPEQKTSQFKGRAACWLVGGFALGVVLSASLGFTRQQQDLSASPAVTSAVEKCAASVRPAVVAEPEPPVTTDKELEKKRGSGDKMISVTKAQSAEEGGVAEPKSPVASPVSPEPLVVVAEKAQQWWPAGHEFSAAAPLTVVPDPRSAVANELSSVEKEKIYNQLTVWAESWSEQNLTEYFSCYSQQYRPPGGKSRTEWQQNRLSRILRPEWIKVELQGIRMRRVADSRVQVKFQQKYSSSTYQDQIWKSINLVREGSDWKIITERSLGRVDLVASR